MASLIKYCSDSIIVVEVKEQVFYLDTINGFPKVYDGGLGLLKISCFDTWFLNMTENQVDYKILKLMAESFVGGQLTQFDQQDLVYIMGKTVELTVSSIFKTDLGNQYCNKFWVEVLSDDEYNKLKRIIKSKLEQLGDKYGDEELYNICCRIWQYCNLNRPDESPVFEKIIDKNMGQKPKLPKYPATNDLDKEVSQLVEGMLLGEQPPVKNVSLEVIKNVQYVQTRRL
tara:strand:- start:1240 stop:1923 length:684 start_codon:yes stop_codon:yes gene_type:complete